MTLGQRIKDSRKKKKLTQKELAEMIGAKHNSVSNWENDQNRPDPDTIETLCWALGVTPNYLLTGEDSFGPVEITDATEDILLGKIRQLNDAGKAKLSNYADDLLQIDQYRAEKTPLAIVARDAKVVKPEKPIDTDAMIQGLSQLEPTENR